MIPLSLLLLVCGTTWFGWLFFRWSSFKSPLGNIPGPPSDSFWLGNIFVFLNRHGEAFQKEIVEKYPPVANIKGIFGCPALYVHDPKALHSILIEDQYTYTETYAFRKLMRSLFGPGMLSSMGEQHRRQRKLLNPIFSARHLRSLLPVFFEVAHSLRDALMCKVDTRPREIDMAVWMSRTSLDLIGRGGLGYSFDAIAGKVDAFGESVKSLVPAITELGILRLVVPYATSPGPSAFLRRLQRLIPHQGLQTLRTIIETLHEKSTEIYHAKRAALLRGDGPENNKDILTVFIRQNMATSKEDRVPEDEMVAQISELVLAGVDTTSNTLCLILHLLAQHPDAQERLRNEIVDAQNGKDLPYDDLMRLPYLDAVCRESLRLHPLATSIARTPETDMVLTLSEPIRGIDGTLMHDVSVPKGTLIFIGVIGSNCNKHVWGEDAFEWKPERWLTPLPSTVTDAHIPGVYANLMSFLGGGRACIGFKYAELEMKVVLTILLSTFTFELTDKPIVWNVAHVHYPTVGHESNKLELPLRVGLVRNRSA
ncbi:cytochrome P450 monooxygenase [Amylocystis lapponica]|nr:cytochrome P450 monooxygenase [Amylocystis lapponica]